MTEKLRRAILRRDGSLFDPKATVAVSPEGQVTITNSPGFNPATIRDADYGVPGGDVDTVPATREKTSAKDVKSRKIPRNRTFLQRPGFCRKTFINRSGKQG